MPPLYLHMRPAKAELEHGEWNSKGELSLSLPVHLSASVFLWSLNPSIFLSFFFFLATETQEKPSGWKGAEVWSEKKEPGDVKKKKKLHLLKGVYGKKKGVNANKMPEMVNINTVCGYLHSQSPLSLFVVIHRSKKKTKKHVEAQR